MNEAKLIMDTPEEDPVENKYDESSMSNEDEAEEAASNSHLQDESSKCIYLFTGLPQQQKNRTFIKKR